MTTKLQDFRNETHNFKKSCAVNFFKIAKANRSNFYNLLFLKILKPELKFKCFYNYIQVYNNILNDFMSFFELGNSNKQYSINIVLFRNVTCSYFKLK